MSKPDLSVAIIFKNEIRCLERCLKSLQPLRERLSLQIVMADTGSTDGSRAVAEQYADVLFDFPWINDFAAARNAVLERCRGRWVLSIDCDEWLESIDGLAGFLLSKRTKNFSMMGIIVRNYTDAAFKAFHEFPAARLACMDAKPYFRGAIHEELIISRGSKNIIVLKDVVLNHDGYVMLNDGSEEGKAKIRRNLDLLRQELDKEPEDLHRLLQWLESGKNEPNYLAEIRRAVSLVKDRKPAWETFGPAIMREAIFQAINRSYPEDKIWTEYAFEWFPKSYFTRLDLNFLLMENAYLKGSYQEAVQFADAYFDAYSSFQGDFIGVRESSVSPIQRSTPDWATFARLRLAEIDWKLHQPDQALAELEKVRWESLPERYVFWTLRALREMYEDGIDVSVPLLAFWNGVHTKNEYAMQAANCEKTFLDIGVSFLHEPQKEGVKPVCGMFAPLCGKCFLGDAAALMTAETPEEADALLEGFNDITELPAAAFVHALKVGAEFPLPGRFLPMELADVMANKLSTDAAFLREAAIFAAQAFESDADLNWARSLALAALQGNDWKSDTDPMPLLRAFVRVESAFLGRCYTTRALDYAAYLPPLHRFGLHLANAYAVFSPATVSPEFMPTVKSGMRGALAELKEAVIALPEQKAVVDVVLDAVSGGTL